MLLLNECLSLLLFISLSTQSGIFWLHHRTYFECKLYFHYFWVCIPLSKFIWYSNIFFCLHILCHVGLHILSALKRMKFRNKLLVQYEVKMDANSMVLQFLRRKGHGGGGGEGRVDDGFLCHFDFRWWCSRRFYHQVRCNFTRRCY